MTWPLPDKLPGKSKRVLVPRDVIETICRILNHITGNGLTTITKTAAPDASNPWQVDTPYSAAAAGGGGALPSTAGQEGKYLGVLPTEDAAWLDLPADSLPDQSGHAGELLKTDGTAAAWVGLSVMLGTLLEGAGSGYLYWNDTSNLLETDYTLGFNRIFGGTGAAERIMTFQANGTAETKSLSQLLGSITTGKSVGMVLTATGEYTFKWDWVRAV